MGKTFRREKTFSKKKQSGPKKRLHTHRDLPDYQDLFDNLENPNEDDDYGLRSEEIYSKNERSDSSKDKPIN